MNLRLSAFICGLLFILAACDSYADPYQARDAADQAIRQTQRAVSVAQANQVEQDRQAQEYVMQTAQAAQVEIDQMNAAAIATQTALASEQQALDLAVLAGQSTRAAWEYGLSQTATLASLRVTQTVMPLKVTEAAANASAAQNRARTWPMAIMMMSVLILAVTGLIIRWLIDRLKINLDHHRMLVEIEDRKNSAVETRNGTALFKSAEIIAGGETEKIYPNLTETTNYSLVAPAPEPAAQRNPDNLRAIRLLGDAESIAGADADKIPSWRDLPGWSSESWQRAVGYMRTISLVRSDNSGTYLTTGSIATVRWQLVSGQLPSPTDDD